MKITTSDETNIDIIGMPLGFLGALVAIGAIPLAKPRYVTALVGLVLMLAGHSELLSFKFTFSGLRFSVRAVFVAAAALGLFYGAAAINAIFNLFS